MRPGNFDGGASNESNFAQAKPLSPTALKNPLIRKADLSLESFLLDYIGQCSPVVICKGAGRWPAVQKWNVEYIWHLARFRTVPVEIGSSYADDEWSQSLMTIGDFIQKFFIDSHSSIGYLAQHHLLDQVIELRQDILIPDYCMTHENEVEINAWFGPGRTISPLHFDPRNNILVQIFGRKYVRLYAPSETARLYPHESIMLKNTSKVDVSSPNLELYPDFEYASYVECILEPGDMLFIPKKWWHFVKSLENSFSVNFWFGDA
uniref:JmjC domain-containing protein n=1 Tax=Romanomermis culicivorax TaxID=13658 RepID=A0A915IGY2_ROMCU